ncbi:MAG: hypothetical protein HY903_03220 [Deltaproteobacteria bacterium]|nr:hypothetical protein [Deltaproteobacteria bacterium]
MKYEAAYREIITDIMRTKVSLFGAAAVRRARAIAGLQVNDTGVVTELTGDPLTILSALLASFEQLSGKISTVSARTSVRRLGVRERYPDIELPAGLC